MLNNVRGVFLEFLTSYLPSAWSQIGYFDGTLWLGTSVLAKDGEIRI